MKHAEHLCSQGGVVRGTQLALQYMGKHNGGKGGAVLNVASVAGLGSITASSVYNATKYFVVGYCQSVSVSSIL
jgi:15-hydroxyprostaglandin dehydrogenase (NAD)